MNKSLLALTVLLCGTATAALAIMAPQGADAAPPVSSSHAAQPAAMQAGLCGMTQATVLDIRDHYQFDLDVSEIQAALQTPFNCEAYGELCDVLSEQDAHTYTCNVWNALDAEMSMSTISYAGTQYIEENGIGCTPDPAVCEAQCGPFEVLTDCVGAVEVIDGNCVSIGVCERPNWIHIIGFDFLRIFALAQ